MARIPAEDRDPINAEAEAGEDHSRYGHVRPLTTTALPTKAGTQIGGGSSCAGAVAKAGASSPYFSG
ncbi:MULTISPECIES: hypothetical protein [Sorangium]|uniref:hypothetical protein n=1 Tax=Sorangium TaxID=39643 RepID=UPI00101A4511|nr:MULTISPECIES: hypothetical protein [Sorangium]